MRILFSPERTNDDTTAEQEFKNGYPLKFVMTTAHDAVTTTLFVRSIQHIEKATQLIGQDPAATFVGAGRIDSGTMRDGEEAIVEWDSNTCRDALGYDRPTDEQVRNVLTEALRTRLSETFKKQA